MAYETIIYEKDTSDSHIAYIILNRPDKANAISIGPGMMTDEIIQAVHEADTDPGVKVLIFKANGKNFSAGFDLSMVYRVYGGGPGVKPHQATRLQIDNDHVLGMPRAIVNCNKITIAQVHGWCIEAAIWITECCDIAIAADNTKFAHRGQRLAFGGQALMPFEMFQGNPKQIMETLLTGRTFSADEAVEQGVLTRAVEPEDLENEVYNLAKALCLIPIDAVVMGKTARRQQLESVGMINLIPQTVFHTLSTNLVYADDEKDLMFIKDRESKGEREAFHKLHDAFDGYLEKTKYFKNYKGE